MKKGKEVRMWWNSDDEEMSGDERYSVTGNNRKDFFESKNLSDDTKLKRYPYIQPIQYYKSI